jgi:hypothetical protein
MKIATWNHTTNCCGEGGGWRFRVERQERWKKEKAYAEGTEDAEFTEKKEKPKTQAHSPCLGHPPHYLILRTHY